MSLKPFTTLSAKAVALLRDNIDTDQIIPSREMKSVSKTGLKDGLFAGWRYLNDRVENPEFVLNKPQYKTASILLSGQNFGCGSSREHAVWALKEYGFRAVIAEGFGDIFYKNCVRNGIAAIVLHTSILNNLAQQTGEITIDLPNQSVSTKRLSFSFDIDAADKRRLVLGLDPIAETLEYDSQISAHFKSDKAARPWNYL